MKLEPLKFNLLHSRSLGKLISRLKEILTENNQVPNKVIIRKKRIRTRIKSLEAMRAFGKDILKKQMKIYNFKMN